jgi:starvation-inducible outer membrane lipoprotein
MLNHLHTRRRWLMLCGVFAALCLTSAGCVTSPQVSLLETENRVLKTQNKVQEEELAQLKQERQLLAARAQEAEIELAKTHTETMRR